MACIAKRRDRYVIDFYDNQGKRQRQTLKKGTSKKAAKEKMREIEDQLSKGSYLPEKKIPTFEEVAKDYLEYKKLNLRASTWATLEGHTRNHFDEINKLKVNRITTAKIEKWIAKRQKDSMNIATLRKVLLTFGQIISYSVRHRYISYNPIKDIERPRDQGRNGKKKINILKSYEIKSFLDAVDNKKYKTLFMLAIMSGARQGELLGLKWTDIDSINNQIHIQRTFNNQAWYDVKTETSNRRVDLGPTMMTELKKWRLACPKCNLDLVFPNEAGQPINHNNLINRHYNPALEKAGIGKLRFHDLRHTYASLMIEQGENIKYIQSQLGHSNPTVTLNVYAHLMKPVNQEAAIRLEKAIF
ncbi:MAG: site-specific integrase [Proteobacteria bacterium]|nr:site-specific integrase [Pseudomonadota bacterium]MBU4259636.1 site-specific integrase [Pseudomonadota bacterium]MBU4287367.1 site-specific integrase [Pseudomonadota bacterium]MCG2758035.1 site-specific integrase [Desulfobacteraceae bacterium]